MREPTVAAGAVRALMELAVSRGASRTTLAERSRIGCADLEDADDRIPFSRYVALMRAGQELCDDPALALHFGEAVEPSEISITHAMGGAAILGDAGAPGDRWGPSCRPGRTQDLGPVWERAAAESTSKTCGVSGRRSWD